MAKYPKNVKQAKELELKRLHRNLQKLWRSVLNLGTVELPKPRMMGWKRYFVLRPDFARRKDGKEILEVLEKINTFVYSRTKDFSRYDYDDRPFNEKQRVKSLSKKVWDTLTPQKKAFFYPSKHRDFRKSEIRYVFDFPDYSLLHKVKRHYITHVPILDSELESQIDELENKVRTQNLWPKIYKLMGWSRRNRYDEDFRMKLKEILLDEAIMDAYKEMD